jgi:DNA-binding beta-propeller fold protein YncE
LSYFLRFRAKALIMAVIAIAVAGCGTRDRENPLDPQNPDTKGNPQWLEAIADDGAVDLSWQVPEYTDIDTVRLVDVVNDAVIWTGDLGGGAYRDEGLTNGVLRQYRLDLVLNTGTITKLPVEAATPGKNIPWVYDLGRGEVVRMSPDGLRRRTGYFDPATLAVVADPDSGFVLVLDFFADRIVLLDRNAEELWVKEDYRRPNAAAHVPGGGWWVTDSEDGFVRRLDANGEPLEQYGDFSFPIDVGAVGDSLVWVADGTGLVGLLRSGQGFVVVDTLGAPRALAVTQDGGTWVSDRSASALVRLSPAGVEVRRVTGYVGVDAIAPDPLGNGVWVGDRRRRSVTLLDEDGNVVMTASGFPATSSISVSPDGSEAWIADSSLGKVVRLSRSGEVLSRSLDLSSPVSVSVVFRQ